ncbi:hypothetical protein POTOM_055802 [Populus tomentosa]|uniref:Transcription factor HY5 n=1 Tax=Populus tomentosa TaxID=118781 RepID=A0A8X7XXY5_POPTO|nr:hypothetical protein POTOM_055802 [Populus tomentosa]
MESDEEIRRVPEMSGEPAGTSASGRETGSNAGPDRVQPAGEGQSQRKRGRSPADKENKRLKRLLRNRVSAQQARERKKAYLTELETRVKDLEKKNSELEERLSTLQNENQMLRHILKNTTASRRGGSSGTNAEGSYVMQMVHALFMKDVFFQQSDHGQPFDFTLMYSALCVNVQHPPLSGCVKIYSDVATLRRGRFELGVLVCNNTGEIM